MAKNILIISNSADLHADLIEPVLRDKGAQPFRLNLDRFPKDYAISQAIFGQHWQGRLTHTSSNQTIALNEIDAVWTRKPGEFTFLSENLQPQELAHAKQETEHFLNGIIHALDCFWMNHPLSSRSAMWKNEQTLRAAKMGFEVAPMLVTNEPDEVKTFHQSAPGPLVLKSLSSPFVGADKVAYEERSLDKGLRTTLLTDVHMQNVESVREIPCYFQHYFDKAYELRVTVIGERVFAVKIHSQDSERTKVDFRDFGADIRYEAYRMTPQLENKCKAFVHSYGLMYGAMDLMVTAQQEYVFLENNPAGQFWFVEQRVPQLTMMEALADSLIEGTLCRK